MGATVRYGQIRTGVDRGAGRRAEKALDEEDYLFHPSNLYQTVVACAQMEVMEQDYHYMEAFAWITTMRGTMSTPIGCLAICLPPDTM